MNTCVLWAALKLIAGEFDLSLQDRKVGAESKSRLLIFSFDYFF